MCTYFLIVGFSERVTQSIQVVIVLLLLVVVCALAGRILIPRFIRRRLHIQHVGHPLLVPLRGSWRLLRLTATREAALGVKQLVLDNFPLTPLEFLAFVEDAAAQRQIPGVNLSLIARREFGLFSLRRWYLHVSYQTSLCIIGAAPLGNALAISWRLGEIGSWASILLREYPRMVTVIDWFLRPPTFYRIDVNEAFQQLADQMIVEAIDRITDVRGLRALNAAERQQILDPA